MIASRKWGHSGFTLIEALLAMVLGAVIFTGALGVVRNISALDQGFEEIGMLYAEIGQINRMLRDDLAGIELSVNIEPFSDANGDGLRNASEAFLLVDDPSTLRLSYAPTVNRNEATGPPGDDPSTPYNESVTDDINLPYGQSYDYFFGITNNGYRDVLSFRGRVRLGDGVRPAMVTYRLVERSHKCNGDTGIDLLRDEFEPGYHPLYHPDPNNDNVSGVFNPEFLFPSNPSGRKETEGDGNSNLSSCPDTGAEPLYQFQRIIALAPGEVIQEVISRAVVGFNLLYYDRQRRQYLEPEPTSPTSPLKAFGYSGTTGTFDVSGLLSSLTVTDGFWNLNIGDRVYLEQVGAIQAGLYRITEKVGGGLRFDLQGQTANLNPVIFRAAYLPPAIKAIITVKADLEGVSDSRSLMRAVPLTIYLGKQT